MDFAEMFEQVTIATARPDLVNETITQLQKATRRMHGLDFWFRDFVSRIVPIPENSSTQYFTYQVDIKRDLPNMRKLWYVRKWDTVGLAPGQFFRMTDPSAALDGYALNRTNVLYRAGDNLNLVSSTADLALLIGYHKWPVTSPLAAYSSWIADDYPYAITDEATSVVFSMIGKFDEAAAYAKKVNNPSDPMSPGWIQQIFAHELELMTAQNIVPGNSFYNYVGNPWLSS